MANVFGAGGDSLDLSNNATQVFVEVLTLAVSALAEREWDHRFAALLALQDQNVMGRGAVGFDLADLDWGPSAEEREAAKDFVLRVVALAARRHRWDELGYDPPHAEAGLRRFRAIVEGFDPATAHPAAGALPAEGCAACCVRHRVLGALPLWDGCVFCHG
ncbi:hypothetical protein [Streptomyces sp. NPDC053367]|uniref:hypothetical protein n=1 Tax=Streptomyces sp. NPDC053367 TaxID=3365700 RepID=UPI0037D74418